MPTKPNLTPEILLPRLGDYMVEKGLLSPEDLKRALNRQKELRASGQPVPLIGQILIEMGAIDRPGLETVITEQIISLRAALQEANAHLELKVQQRTAELEEALNKLAELNQLKSNFVANISHELRTPLTHIKGYLDLLISGDFGPLTSEQNHALSIMARSSDRLEHLIEDLIQFSLAENNQVSLNLQSVDLAKLCKTAIQNASKKAEQTSVDLCLDLPDFIPLVEADEEKIGWVITQLLDNAIKFSPNGGKVTLHLVVEKRTVCISVADNGIGIPADKINLIFEPFLQLDGSSTRKFGGTGLGLAMVKKIIEAHGSIIQVHSREGSGTQFEFYLNLVPAMKSTSSTKK